MPSHKSAEKRDRQRPKRRLRNREAIGSMRSAVKRAREAIDGSADNGSDVAALVRAATSAIDRAVKKGAVHHKAGARYISRLARRKSAV